MRHLFKIVVGLLSLFVVVGLLSYPQQVHAQDTTYTVDYDFHYYIQQNSSSVDVELSITLTNLRSDVYVTEYTMRFPKNFVMKNLEVSSKDKQVPYVVADKNGSKELTFRFGEPEGGAFTQNYLTLKYKLDNMHTPKGRINEVILPLLVSSENSKVNATLHLPENFDKKISISKPVPTAVEFRKIYWENVDARTIFALFGTSQVYDVQLSYSLENSGITPTTKTIALPPETLHQKVYIDSLDPKPHKTYTDEDGNFLAEYKLSPRSTVGIDFKGYVEVMVRPQSTLRDYVRSAYNNQKSYLLTEEEQWKLGDYISVLNSLPSRSPADIYAFTRDKLDYSLKRLSEDPRRFGAEKALGNPSSAVCMEFTDVFIALARESGIPTREIQGFGYSESNRIRPQSLVQDVLHAWPEYYDEEQNIWHQVDPTWEDTSGIDYFSGFDVNHIALAIHGKDPIYPLPAGFYKTEPSKDVHVAISSLKPEAKVTLDIDHSIQDRLQKGKTYTSNVYVTNTGNAFVHDIYIIPDADNIVFHTNSLQVQYLAPFETRELEISFTPSEQYSESDVISFTYEGSVLGSHTVQIDSPKGRYINLVLAIAGGAVILFTIYIFVKSRKR